jgi:predicted GH43/DUF377 family glycosyl hydrolase
MQEPGWVSTPLIDPASEGGVRILRIRKDDPDLHLPSDDARGFDYKGRGYLTTLSHLRLAWSEDGRRFVPEAKPTLTGEGRHESFGIEDCRVEWVGDRYWLTYTAVSEFGVGAGLASTTDWKTFERRGLILPPHNKDVGLFPEKIGGAYWLLHRPSGLGPGGHYIWTARSPDMLHWGGHVCVAATRPSIYVRSPFHPHPPSPCFSRVRSARIATGRQSEGGKTAGHRDVWHQPDRRRPMGD